jgi:hypothetical protein
MIRPVIYIADIVGWAKAFHERHGRWPKRDDGPVEGQVDLTWCGIDLALKRGNRGLRPGSSLAKLFLKRFGRRHPRYLPEFSIEQILAWADAHRSRTGEWPSLWDGKIARVHRETWLAVDHALRRGTRGLAGNSSLAQLLAERRGVRNNQGLPKFTRKQVLAWADAHYARTGSWPTRKSGTISEAPDERWSHVNEALLQGLRGFAPGGSLARFLAKYRGVRNRKALPKVSVRQILAWADAHRARTGKWPTYLSGAIPESPGDTWSAIHDALGRAHRGLPGNDSLYRLLKRHGRRRVPNSSQ